MTLIYSFFISNSKTKLKFYRKNLSELELCCSSLEQTVYNELSSDIIIINKNNYIIDNLESFNSVTTSFRNMDFNPDKLK